MRTHSQGLTNDERLVEDNTPSEEAKAAYYHKAYEPPSETVLEYLRKLRRKKCGKL